MKTNINTTHKHNTTKKIINWPEYNKSLQKRGNLSLFVSDTVIHNNTIIAPQKSGVVGCPYKYSDALIELILTIRTLFNLPLRQTTGFIAYLFSLMGLSTDIPDYSTLSRRSSKLHVNFNYRDRSNSEGIVMLIDSSGFKVFGEGEWMVRKHGASYHRTWRETHIAVDFETRDIIGLINTTAHVHDNTQLKPLLQQVIGNENNGSDGNNGSNRSNGYNRVKTIIGDGAYDSKDNYLLGRKLGIEFISPPPKNAVEHLNHRYYEWYDTPGWEERNAVVRHIEEWGLDGWMADVDYHRRSTVENAFYRLKTIFSDRLKSRKAETQYTEQCIKAKIINQFNALGLPKYA